MTLLACFLVVLAAFIHAAWNLMAKRAAAAGAAFVLASGVVACMAYAPWLGWLVVQGHVDWNGPMIACIAASALIHLAYSLCLQRGYQVADLSVVYPVARGTGPMLSAIAAFVILGERPSLRGLLGLVAVIAGIGLISTQGNLAAFRKANGHTGIRWGAVTGGLIASYTVVDAYGVKTLGIAPVVLDWLANLLRLLMLAPVVMAHPSRALGAMRGQWLLALGVGLLSPLSYILVLAALDTGAPLSVVAPMREMSMMVGALLGLVVLKERVGPWRLVGCAILAGGVVLLGGA